MCICVKEFLLGVETSEEADPGYLKRLGRLIMFWPTIQKVTSMFIEIYIAKGGDLKQKQITFLYVRSGRFCFREKITYCENCDNFTPADTKSVHQSIMSRSDLQVWPDNLHDCFV